MNELNLTRNKFFTKAGREISGYSSTWIGDHCMAILDKEQSDNIIYYHGNKDDVVNGIIGANKWMLIDGGDYTDKNVNDMEHHYRCKIVWVEMFIENPTL